jgi:hypothetical protein
VARSSDLEIGDQRFGKIGVSKRAASPSNVSIRDLTIKAARVAKVSEIHAIAN